MSQEHEQEQKYVIISNRNRLKAYIQGKGRFKGNWSNPLTTQVQHIYMAKKDRCQAHIKLEEIPMWTKGQNVYFIWEMFSNAISLLYCVHSLGLRHISLTQPTQQIANGGRGKFT
jgi:hypothetical protein